MASFSSEQVAFQLLVVPSMLGLPVSNDHVPSRGHPRFITESNSVLSCTVMWSDDLPTYLIGMALAFSKRLNGWPLFTMNFSTILVPLLHLLLLGPLVTVYNPILRFSGQADVHQLVRDQCGHQGPCTLGFVHCLPSTSSFTVTFY